MDQVTRYVLYSCADEIDPLRKLIKYFLVTEDEDRPPVMSEKHTLIRLALERGKEQDKVRNIDRHKIVNDESGKDTPWLNHTGWKRRFAGQDMSQLVQMISLDIRDEESWLKDVESQVCQMVELAYGGI